MESVTEGQNKCPSDFQKPVDHVVPLENGIIDKGKNKEFNEARNDTPSFFSPNLTPPYKDICRNNTSINSVHQESFLSKLDEIDEGLSKLSVVSLPNYEGTRKEHSSHEINEEVKESARVCQGPRFSSCLVDVANEGFISKPPPEGTQLVELPTFKDPQPIIEEIISSDEEAKIESEDNTSEEDTENLVRDEGFEVFYRTNKSKEQGLNTHLATALFSEDQKAIEMTEGMVIEKSCQIYFPY
nr:hypothetical protein CFP56_13900 [Quercus suber]